MSIATMSRPKRDSAKGVSAKRAPRRKAECKPAQAPEIDEQESPATPQTTGGPADITGLFPIRTHALNAADHELIETARKATEAELQARALVGDAETDPPEAAALFDQATQAILHMSDIEAQTWDGFLARQIAVAVWTGESRTPQGGQADVWSEYAAARDVARLLRTSGTAPPLIQSKQKAAGNGSTFRDRQLLEWLLDGASGHMMRAREIALALTESMERHPAPSESMVTLWHGMLAFLAQHLDDTSGDLLPPLKGGVQ